MTSKQYGPLSCLIFLALTACSAWPEVDLTLHESDRGVVYLQRMPDRSLQAAHPIKISANVVSKVLRGVYVRDQQGILQDLLAGKAEEYRVFSDDNVSYLAPLLSEALSQAASDQLVGFRLTQDTDSQSTSTPPSQATTRSSRFSTGGSLYAYGRSLYVTLERYHPPARSTATTGPQRGLPDTSGLAGRAIIFYPEAAKRPDTYREGHSAASTLVIDYERLAALPLLPAAPAPTKPLPATPSNKNHDLRSIQPADTGATPRDLEIQSLRKELEDIKRRLAEQEAEQKNSLQHKPKN